eukprot:CAMPEP_0202871318 /NCGR_PEP_ID=MMETSP1391-20130828/18365_1 /ASSEMBLY_ACC=CAM_ASM_000867 /TAXON_ID=1034604 /ORGANISM="Chlamydomonas leiostraca, Strain SAG 11-49" /LENGTH=148 /DNA_ID=CAMNT_0049552073 /DNA_START=260 /DNA_END=706 /DNA_ORIENTATION=-
MAASVPCPEREPVMTEARYTPAHCRRRLRLCMREGLVAGGHGGGVVRPRGGVRGERVLGCAQPAWPAHDGRGGRGRGRVPALRARPRAALRVDRGVRAPALARQRPVQAPPEHAARRLGAHLQHREEDEPAVAAVVVRARQADDVNHD